jgi:hypothetical protein
MATLVRPGGLTDVQDVRSLVFEPKAIDGTYSCSGYLSTWPVNGTTRGNSGGTFRIEPTPKVQDPSDILVFAEVRIYDARTQKPLTNGSKVCIYISF